MSSSLRPAVGSILIHPQHGLAEVTAIREREIDGKQVEHAVLDLENGNDLLLMMPIDVVAEETRAIMDEDRIPDVWAVFEEPPQTGPSWQSRRKRNKRRLISGEPENLARVVRDLECVDQVKGLSFAEKRQLDKARLRLITEMAACNGHSAEEVGALLDEHIPEFEDDDYTYGGK